MDTSNNYMQDLKLCEITMLKEFISICNQLNLHYFIDYGTLIGAVRHKGFIPWDDDIDIGMPREDYEKFISVGQKYLPSYYFIQTFYTDPEWPTNYAKIRDSRTTFIESSVRNLNINHGVFIDIFPFVYYDVKKIPYKWFEFKNKLLAIRINQIYTVPKENIGFLKKIKNFLMNSAVKILFPTVQIALKYRDKLFKSVSKGHMFANHAYSELTPYEWYGEGTTLEFEGIEVKVPCKYDLLLKHLYGDYMQLPPENERVSNHYTEIIDLHRPYTDYIDK